MPSSEMILFMALIKKLMIGSSLFPFSFFNSQRETGEDYLDLLLNTQNYISGISYSDYLSLNLS